MPSAVMSPELGVQIGRWSWRNPGSLPLATFGTPRELTGSADIARSAGFRPRPITNPPRQGNAPWRTVETSAGMLNSIGLDNDGIDAFVEHHLPYLSGLGTPIIVSIAGCDYDEFVTMSAQLDGHEGIAAIELNISCPNV